MYQNERDTKFWITAGLIALTIIFALITLFSAMRVIGTGEVGVVAQYGKVTGRELREGMSWVLPWGINTVTKYDVKNIKEEVDSGAATKDLQDVSGKLVLNYQLNSGEVSRMHQEVGKEYRDKLIFPALNETFKAVTAKYNASELITRRAEVKNEVTDQLVDRLEKYGIAVLDVSIVDFRFSEEFNKAIEAVQIANQNVSRARQELETTKVEAEKRIAEAQAAAESQRLQQQTLTRELLDKQWIEKWDGKLPQYAGDGANFYIPAQ